MKITSLRITEDIYDAIVEGYAIFEDRSMNKMINILLAEAINYREIKASGSPIINVHNVSKLPVRQ
jgi:hypothetical protein